MNQLVADRDSTNAPNSGEISNKAFEQLVQQALTVFTRVTTPEVDKKIKFFMDHLRNLMKVDNCYFFQYDPRSGKADMTYRSMGPEAAAFLKESDFRGLPIRDVFPVVSEKIIKGRPLIVRNEKDLKIFSRQFQKTLLDLGVKSVLYVPVKTADRFYGAFGFDSISHYIDWSNSTITRLQLLGNILANVFDRTFKESKILEIEKELSDLKLFFGRLNKKSKEEDRHVEEDRPIIGKSRGIIQIAQLLKQQAYTDFPVAIIGEAGTGKDFYAKKIHVLRDGSKGFFQIDCRLVFKGSMAQRILGVAHKGAEGEWIKDLGFEKGGSLVLGHIESLEDKYVPNIVPLTKLCMSKPHAVKVICTASPEFLSGHAKGSVDTGLFQTLTQAQLIIPPLRDRKEDIPDFVRYFANRFAAEIGIGGIVVPEPYLEALMSYDWPFNLVELRHVIESALLSHKSGILDSAHFSSYLLRTRDRREVSESLDDVIKAHILNVVKRCNWKIEGKGGASRILQLNPSTLRSKMRKYGISRT